MMIRKLPMALIGGAATFSFQRDEDQNLLTTTCPESRVIIVEAACLACARGKPDSFFSRVSSRSRGRNCVPAGVTGLFIIPRQFVPVRTCNSVQIIDHFPFSKRQLAGELLRSSQSSPIHINKAEGAFLKPEYCDVGHGA